MRSKAIVGSLLALTLMVSGCMTMVVPGAEVAGGNVVFTAVGSAALVKADDPMALVEARTAAAAIARAELLAKIKGTAIESTVQVKDLTFASQEAELQVDGMLARTEINVCAHGAHRPDGHDRDGGGAPDAELRRILSTLRIRPLTVGRDGQS